MRRRSIKGERRKERGKEERGVVWERERYIYIYSVEVTDGEREEGMRG